MEYTKKKECGNKAQIKYNTTIKLNTGIYSLPLQILLLIIIDNKRHTNYICLPNHKFGGVLRTFQSRSSSLQILTAANDLNLDFSRSPPFASADSGTAHCNIFLTEASMVCRSRP